MKAPFAGTGLRLPIKPLCIEERRGEAILRLSM
jgi:hypothetical protein